MRFKGHGRRGNNVSCLQNGTGTVERIAQTKNSRMGQEQCVSKTLGGSDLGPTINNPQKQKWERGTTWSTNTDFLLPVTVNILSTKGGTVMFGRLPGIHRTELTLYWGEYQHGFRI